MVIFFTMFIVLHLFYFCRRPPMRHVLTMRTDERSKYYEISRKSQYSKCSMLSVILILHRKEIIVYTTNYICLLLVVFFLLFFFLILYLFIIFYVVLSLALHISPILPIILISFILVDDDCCQKF